MLLSSSDTKRTLMHLFLFTNSTQREFSICTQSIRNCNYLSLHYNRALTEEIVSLSHRTGSIVSTDPDRPLMWLERDLLIIQLQIGYILE